MFIVLFLVVIVLFVYMSFSLLVWLFCVFVCLLVCLFSFVCVYLYVLWFVCMFSVLFVEWQHYQSGSLGEQEYKDKNVWKWIKKEEKEMKHDSKRKKMKVCDDYDPHGIPWEMQQTKLRLFLCLHSGFKMSCLNLFLINLFCWFLFQVGSDRLTWLWDEFGGFDCTVWYVLLLVHVMQHFSLEDQDVFLRYRVIRILLL